MKILKVIVKVILSILVMMFFTQGAPFSDPASAVGFFAACYGLVTWYMLNFSSGMIKVYGDDVLVELIFGLILNLGLPLLVIVIPLFILESLLGTVGTIIYGIILFISLAACILRDVVQVARMFNPTFLGGFGDIFDFDLDMDD